MVSIHAPARGATRGQTKTAGLAWFQSTRPRGARLEVDMISAALDSFNPRARAGRDGKHQYRRVD